MSGPRTSVHEMYLQAIPLAVITDEDKPFAKININFTIEDTLYQLSKNIFKVLPVWDDKQNKYISMVSRLDILSMLVWSKDNQWRKSSIKDIIETEEHIIDNRIWQYTLDDTVISLLDPFSKGVHHILVKNNEYDPNNEEIQEKPYYILSQC